MILEDQVTLEGSQSELEIQLLSSSSRVSSEHQLEPLLDPVDVGLPVSSSVLGQQGDRARL